MTRFAPILLTAIAATIGLSSARAVGLNPQGVTARQDPYDIQWSFLSSEVGGEFVHFGAPVNGLWQDIVDREYQSSEYLQYLKAYHPDSHFSFFSRLGNDAWSDRRGRPGHGRRIA